MPNENARARPKVTHSLRIRVTETERNQIKQEASRYGYEVSSLLRLRIFGKVDGMRITRRPSADMVLLGDILGNLLLRRLFQTVHSQMDVGAAMDKTLSHNTIRPFQRSGHILRDGYILADCFDLNNRKLRVFRITQRGTATVLWTSEKAAQHYLQNLHAKKLQARS